MKIHLYRFFPSNSQVGFISVRSTPLASFCFESSFFCTVVFSSFFLFCMCSKGPSKKSSNQMEFVALLVLLFSPFRIRVMMFSGNSIFSYVSIQFLPADLFSRNDFVRRQHSVEIILLLHFRAVTNNNAAMATKAKKILMIT